jgi:hypothetical protein
MGDSYRKSVIGDGCDYGSAISDRRTSYAGPGRQSESAWYFLSKRLVAGISRSDCGTRQHTAGEPLGSHQQVLWIQQRWLLLSTPGDLPSPTHKVEATKTEPNKNTYLVSERRYGGDPTYNYGTHFLFQGHENRVNTQGILTRINLDADAAHRVTLLAEKDKNGVPLLPIDVSMWYPVPKRVLFSAERGTQGGIYRYHDARPHCAKR